VRLIIASKLRSVLLARIAIRLNSLSLQKEVFDQMPPFVHFLVDSERFCSPRVLGDDDLGAAFIEVGDDGVAVERLVCNQRVEGQPFDQRRDADRGRTRCPGSSTKRTSCRVRR